MRTAQTRTDHQVADEEALVLLEDWSALPCGHPERAALRARVIEAFLPLAYRMAGRYRRTAEDIEDLRQVASVALIGAVDRYDPRFGRGFYAFAIPTISGELKRHFRDHAWAVQPTRRIQEMWLQLHHVGQRLAQELGRPPTAAELARAMGVDIERVVEALDADRYHQPVSLSSPSPGPSTAAATANWATRSAASTPAWTMPRPGWTCRRHWPRYRNGNGSSSACGSFGT